MDGICQFVCHINHCLFISIHVLLSPTRLYWYPHSRKKWHPSFLCTTTRVFWMHHLSCKAVKQYIAFFSSSAWSALYSNSMILSSSCKAIRTLTHSLAFRGWNCLSQLVRDFLIHLKTINQKPCHSARCTVAASFTFSLSSPISMSWKDQHTTTKHTQRGKLKPVSISFLQLWTQIFECSTYFLHQKRCFCLFVSHLLLLVVGQFRLTSIPLMKVEEKSWTRRIRVDFIVKW